jgi:hypothetical protein
MCGESKPQSAGADLYGQETRPIKCAVRYSRTPYLNDPPESPRRLKQGTGYTKSLKAIAPVYIIDRDASHQCQFLEVARRVEKEICSAMIMMRVLLV